MTNVFFLSISSPAGLLARAPRAKSDGYLDSFIGRVWRQNAWKDWNAWHRFRGLQILYQGPHKLLHNSPRAGHITESDYFGISYIPPNQHIFRKYIIFSLLTRCLRGPDKMVLRAGFGQRAVVWSPLH